MNPLQSTLVPLSALVFSVLPVSAQTTAPVTSDGPYVNRNFGYNEPKAAFSLSVIGCTAAENLIHTAGYHYLTQSDGGSYYSPSESPPDPSAVKLFSSGNRGGKGGTILLVTDIKWVLEKGPAWTPAVQVGWAFDHQAYTNVVPVYQAHLNRDGNPNDEDYFYTENLQEYQNHWDNGWNADGTRDAPSLAYWAPLTKDATECFPGEPPIQLNGG